jgi:uncharacterized protein
MYFDPIWWLFMIPGMLLALYAQMRLTSTYNKYLRIGVDSGITGAQAAREIMDRAGLTDVSVNQVAGHLTDHYDPLKKALFLSEENYHGRSLASVGVAAHEAGHALQHQASYAFLKMRMALVPVTRIASNAVVWIILLGFIMQLSGLIWLAVAAFGVITFFQVITLPVEFDASRRAKVQLVRLGLVSGREEVGVSRVLNAAALTYVAAMVQALLTLLYYLSLARGSSRD